MERIFIKYIYLQYVFVFSFELYTTINGSEWSAKNVNQDNLESRLDRFEKYSYRFLKVEFDDFFDTNEEAEEFCKVFFPNAIRYVKF